MHVVLWHLCIKLITDSIAGIDPKVRRSLFRPGQGAQHTLCYILRCNAEDRCDATVYIDIQLKLIVRLLYPEIHGARNMTDLFHESVRELENSPTDWPRLSECQSGLVARS